MTEPRSWAPGPDDEDEEDLLEIDPDDLILEDDPWLDEVAADVDAAPVEPPPAPIVEAAPAVEEEPEVGEFASEDELEDDDFLEGYAVVQEEVELPIPAAALPPLDTPSQILRPEELHRPVPPAATPPPPAGERARAIALSRTEFESKLAAYDPAKILDERTHSMRRATSLPVTPIPEPEFPLRGFGLDATSR